MTLPRKLQALLGSALCSMSLYAAQPLSPIDVFSLQYVSSPQVDHRGEHVVYLRHTMDIMRDRQRSNLWLTDGRGMTHRPLTTGPGNVGSPALSPDGARVAYIDRDDVGAQIFVQWLDGGQRQQVTRLAESPSSLHWSPDRKWLAFSMLVPEEAPTMGKMPARPRGAEWADPPVVVDRVTYRRDGRGNLRHGFRQLFVLPAAGGHPRQLTEGEFHHGGDIAWAADSSGLFFSANRRPDWALDVNESDIFWLPLEGGEPRAIAARNGPEGSVRVSPDGRQLAFTGYDDRLMSYSLNRLYVMQADGSKRRELLPDLDRSVSDPRWAADGEGLFFQYDDQGDTVLAYTDLDGHKREIARGLGGKQLGRPYSGADYAEGGGLYAYTAGDTSAPAELALGRVGEGTPRRVTQLNDHLRQSRELARVEEFWFKSSADGRDIQAWLALPPGFDAARKYPLLLEIHGGPHTNYGSRFSAEVQLYAAAGYAVLYVNPRGSTSYGAEFANLIHHNYPSQDYDDLMSAVDEVIARGFIDEDQLYVTGGSGGGVLTAWIVGNTDRFRAAVVAKPVINWTSFTLTADLSPYFVQYWFERPPWEDPEGYWRRSPLSLVGNVSTPTMLLTGEEDLRTPISETEQYYQALKLRSVDTAMVRIPGAPHGIAGRPSQLIAKVTAILAWFERHAP